MSDLSNIFTNGCKVVVSPDKMRAWISLVKPAKGVQYTAQAVAEWLPENGVVYGADDGMIRKALASGEYDELLEVARGKAPVAANGGDYTLLVEKKPFTGLKASGDGALIYDDLSFLQEAEAGQRLAEVIPPTPAEDGMTVTGASVPAREGTPGRELTGSGFAVSEDGRYYTAPVLSHVSFVNDQLMVTPLAKLAGLSAEDGPFTFDGNVLVEGDVTQGASIDATGSVFVAGRAVSCTIKSGNNVLLCGGMRDQGGFGTVTAKGTVWGLFFDSANITTKGDIYANHLVGCEVHVNGRASILGGRALVGSTNLYAQNGVVAGTLGDGRGETVVAAGMDKELIDRYNAVVTRTDRLGVDIQSIQQNITTHERVNRMKPDKGKGDAAYREMVQKRDQSLSVYNILTAERTRLKRTIDQFSVVSIIAREVANAGVTIVIDTRSMKITSAMPRTKFRRNQETIEAVSSQSR